METKSVPGGSSSPDELETSPRDVNWAGIEQAYTTTTESAREIARAHGVTHSAIAKRAKKGNWNRPEKETPVSKELAALEPRQQRFVQEYLKEPNAKKAAIKAGYSPRSAQEQSSRLLSKDKVKGAVEAEREKDARKFNLSRERVLAEYAKIGFFDMRQAYHESGALKMPHELDEDTAAAIAGFETVEFGAGGKDAPPLLTRKIKWVPAVSSLTGGACGFRSFFPLLLNGANHVHQKESLAPRADRGASDHRLCRYLYLRYR